MLKALGVDAVHLQTDFAPGTKDPNWIPKVAKDHIIVTSDDDMRRARVEAAALQDNGAIAFFLSHSFPNQPLWRQAELICKYWPKIEAAARDAKPGDMFDVKLNGNVEKKKLK